jgi:CHASE3 domain sensor protein
MKMTHLARSISTPVIAIAAMGATAVGFDLAAQETDASVLSTREIRTLVTERVNTSAERRSALSAFLETSDVRRIATSAGIDIRDVETAAATMSDAEIERLEPYLRSAHEALAGGGTVTIATTTIVIVALALIIILIA